MQIQIGLQNSAQSTLTLESNLDKESLKVQVEAAIKEGQTLILEDPKGGLTYINPEKISYIKLSEEDTSRVGFGLIQ